MMRSIQNVGANMMNFLKTVPIAILAGSIALLFLVPVSSLAGGTVEVWGYQVILPLDEMTDIVKIANGVGYDLALRSDGTLVAWGNNDSGQCDVPVAAEPFVDIAAGNGHGLALTESGIVYEWGAPWGTPLDDPTGFTAIATLGDHSLGLKEDGSIVAWGFAWFGAEIVPEPNEDWVAIAASFDQSFGVKSDGSVFLWGNVTMEWPTPITDVKSIKLNFTNALVLRNDGSIVPVGSFPYEEDLIPEPNIGFRDVDLGLAHARGIRADGTMISWGSGTFWATDPPAPNSGFLSVAAIDTHYVALREDGTVSVWGRNSDGQSGPQPPVPDPVEVSCNDFHGVVLDRSGTISTWGELPPAPEPNEDFIKIATSHNGAAGLKSTGEIVIWKRPFGYSVTPLNSGDYVDVAAGYEHYLGLRSNGSIDVTGYDRRPVPEPNTGFTAIAAGNDVSMGLKEDGSIVVWGGGNPVASVNPPEPNPGYVDMAAGWGWAVVLKDDGTIVAWGGWTTPTEGNHDLVSIDASTFFLVGLHSDGSVEIWDIYGTAPPSFLDVPQPNAGFIRVEIGQGGIAAIRDPAASPVDQDLPGPVHTALDLAVSPNPFNPRLAVMVTSAVSAGVTLEVLDVRGRRVKVIWRGELPAGGSHSAVWDGRDGAGRSMPSGTYFVQARNFGTRGAVQKISLIR